MFYHYRPILLLVMPSVLFSLGEHPPQMSTLSPKQTTRSFLEAELFQVPEVYTKKVNSSL